MPRLSLFTAALVGVLFPSILLAAPATVEESRTDGPPIVVTRGLGTAIHLPKTPRIVSIGDPEVADVQVGMSTIVVVAKKGGDTRLYAEDNDGVVLLDKIVQVRPIEVTVLRGKGHGKEEVTGPSVVINTQRESVTTSTTEIGSK